VSREGLRISGHHSSGSLSISYDPAHAGYGYCARKTPATQRAKNAANHSPTKAISVIRVILRNIQRDLNLLAAYRKIPILGAPPVSITYTRARTRAVYRNSIDELYEMLNTMEGPAAADRARPPIQTLKTP
jgi:hypothetical protein